MKVEDFEKINIGEEGFEGEKEMWKKKEDKLQVGREGNELRGIDEDGEVRKIDDEEEEMIRFEIEN